MRRATLLLVAGWLQDERGGGGEDGGGGGELQQRKVSVVILVLSMRWMFAFVGSLASLCILVGAFPCNETCYTLLLHLMSLLRPLATWLLPFH